MARRREKRIGKAGWGWTAFAGVISLIYFFPVAWIIMTAFKTRPDALATPPKFLFEPTLDNFVRVFSRAAVGAEQAVDTEKPVRIGQRLIGEIGSAFSLRQHRGERRCIVGKRGQSLTS